MLGYIGNLDGGLFDQFRRLEREMDQMFSGGSTPNGIRAVARGTYPPVNIGSSADQVDVYLFAAGIDTKSLNITVQQNLLTIDGERNSQVREEADYFRRERFGGPFHRVITLPDDADAEKVDASYRDGILRISVKRREARKPRQIEVK